MGTEKGLRFWYFLVFSIKDKAAFTATYGDFQDCAIVEAVMSYPEVVSFSVKVKSFLIFRR